MAWTIFGSAIPTGDEPHWDSEIDELGEAVHSRQHPIGGNSRDSDVITYLYTKSPTARLHFWCTTATKDVLVSKRRATGTIVDPWGGSASWYCEDVRPTRFGSPPDPLAGRWHVIMTLTGR